MRLGLNNYEFCAPLIFTVLACSSDLTLTRTAIGRWWMGHIVVSKPYSGEDGTGPTFGNLIHTRYIEVILNGGLNIS